MIRRSSVLVCLVISVILIVVASLLYPGGSILDNNSTGFDWSKNFISNLFATKAINGSENPGRHWAILGMAFHSVGYAIFFLNTSKKLPAKSGGTVLKFIGAVYILFNILIVTPLHDIMVTISSTLSLLGLFYITVFILRTRLHFLKFACIICLLTFYYTLYLYGAGNWRLLAIMQKVSFISSMLLVLGIEYFLKMETFIAINAGMPNE